VLVHKQVLELMHKQVLVLVHKQVRILVLVGKLVDIDSSIF